MLNHLVVQILQNTLKMSIAVEIAIAHNKHKTQMASVLQEYDNDGHSASLTDITHCECR